MPIGKIPVPEPHIEDSPTVQLCINRTWAETLIGQIWGLRYPEAWSGTLEENRRARGEIKNLITMLMGEDSCDMNNCCEVTIYIYRINTDTGRHERSSDGGTTWVPDPVDPIFSTMMQPAPVRDGVSTTKCDAATNFLTHFQDLVTGSSENLGTATSIVQLAGGIAALLLDIFIIIVTEGAGAAIVTAITAAIFSGISAAFAEGKAAFDAYWTSDVYRAVLCAAYCTIGSNGQWTQAKWEEFKHQVYADCPPSAALQMVMTAVNAAGYVGGNNMASYGAAAESDCSDCTACAECPIEWTFYNADVLSHEGNTWVVKTTGAGHFSFTSGNNMQGCYCYLPHLGTWNWWLLGDDSPDGEVDTQNNRIWNMDNGDNTPDITWTIVFSTTPIP